MVQKVEVTLIDDIDGSTADEVITFGLAGKSYEIDLSTKNAKKMRTALEPYVAAARKVTSPQKTTGRGSSRQAASDTLDTAAIREWAKDAGLPISDRGRISADVVEKYKAAH
ncbi:MAG TPA: Lsr2 family protein [Actinocrinis sp.]|nr:Lsr2 family protein [Actinocrinis sp.]